MPPRERGENIAFRAALRPAATSTPDATVPDGAPWERARYNAVAEVGRGRGSGLDDRDLEGAFSVLLLPSPSPSGV